jgi:proteic killer suppression protein
MIKSFKHSWLEEFWNTGQSKRVPPFLKDRLMRKLTILENAIELKDLSSPPSNHLHPLHGDREGQWAISVNGPWRLCFKFEDGDILDVELVQYH